MALVIRWANMGNGEEIDHKNLSVPVIMRVYENGRLVLEWHSQTEVK